MRPKFLVGNWKMNTTRTVAVELASAIAARVQPTDELLVAICPPFPYLEAVAKALAGSRIALGAQNLSAEPSGAFTGEVSGIMLVDLGCRYVIVGHSERRHVLGETDALVRRKVDAALLAGLVPIVCVGEQLSEREAGKTHDVVSAQVLSATNALTEERASRLMFSYEPVWAIGTGRNATPRQADETHSHIRNILAGRYNATLAERTVIQYGGSVKSANAESLLGEPNVDGLLVGGASLQADEFAAIVEAARHVAT